MTYLNLMTNVAEHEPFEYDLKLKAKCTDLWRYM